MSVKAAVRFETVGDLLTSLGGVSPDRVRLIPAPGTATVRDAAHLIDRQKRLFELVDGTLVEKIYGIRKSVVGVQIAHQLWSWNEANGNVGMILGADGPYRLLPKVVRLPDASFTNWDRLPGRKVPNESIPDLSPDLAVDVLSEGHTQSEMERKLKDYFFAEVSLVWYVDPKKRIVRVFTSPDDPTVLHDTDTLDGGDVLPGFSVPVARMFADLGDKPKGKNKR